MNFKKILGFIKKQKNELISEEIRKEIGFSQEILNVIKQATNSSIQPFYATDSKSKIAGVSFVTFEDSAEQQVIKLQSENLSKIWGIIYVKRMIPMIHNYTSNISREQFELIREDLENAR
ncbi:hypothetical protein Q0N88_00990, partial [Bacillus thuringiensis]